MEEPLAVNVVEPPVQIATLVGVTTVTAGVFLVMVTIFEYTAAPALHNTFKRYEIVALKAPVARLAYTDDAVPISVTVPLKSAVVELCHW